MSELSKMSTLEKINFYASLSKKARQMHLNILKKVRDEDRKDPISQYLFYSKSKLLAKYENYANMDYRIRKRLYVLTEIYLFNL